MQDAAVDVTTPGDRIVQRVDRQPGLHPVTDRVSDNPVRVDILHGAKIELAVLRPVFRNVAEPKLVRNVRSELPLHEIIMNWRARLPAVASALLLPERAPPAVVAADPPRGSVRHHLACVAGFINEEPIPELRVVAVRIEQCVGSISGHDFGSSDGIAQPPIVGLTSKLEYPTRHRDGNPVDGELAYERVEPFPGRFACDKYAAARRRTSFSCSSRRLRLRSSRTSSDSLRV